MIVFPNCKINLGLSVIGKRADGYHNLETVFYPIPITDALEIIPQPPAKDQQEIDFSLSGLPVVGPKEHNLCVKACQLLKNDFPQIPALKMHLHKAIPMGAGLGGGSADGAFTLKLLNSRFSLNLSPDRLLNYSLQLGSDCPFFIINKPCFAKGRGDQLEEIKLDISGYKVAVVNPGIHINTAWAFTQIKPVHKEIHINEIIKMPVTSWQGSLLNDFEEDIIFKYPALKQLKNELYKSGADYVSMSGSGSSFYALFQKDIQIDIRNLPVQHFISIAEL